MNIPLMLNLGKNLTEYAQNSTDHAVLCRLVNAEFPAEQLDGHKSACRPQPQTQLGYHGSFVRRKVIDTAGQKHQVRIHRVHCPLCKQTWSVYPSFILPHKHYDAYVLQNVLEDVLSHELTYRAATRQNQQLTSSGEVRPNQFGDARTPWEWVVWLGQFPLPVILLAVGLTPPDYAVEDEKFLVENGEKSYVLGLVDHRYDLLWWLDYIEATSQTVIEASLRRLLAFIYQQTGRPHDFKGITGDDWTATRNAFAAINPATLLAQCLLHPLLKFESVLTTYARLTKCCLEKVTSLKTAFYQVLFAPDKTGWVGGLLQLRQLPEFQHPLLAERLVSLETKAEGLCYHFTDPNLALTSSAIDRQFQRLERKFASMQQFRTTASGRATLNAWAIVQDFRRFGADAKRGGQSPVELAGADLAGLPWLQFIMLKLSQVRWRKKSVPDQLTQS
jgi:hypothetical protein